jgi:type II secretory pathway component PulC
MKHPLPDRLPGVALVVWALLAVAGPARAAAPAAVEARASVARDVFDGWLDRGPQYLLSQVVPLPVTVERRFVGFRLSRWFPAHPDVTEGTLRRGDVIQRVNGRSVEHPDQFLFVWKQLHGAAAVVIEGQRDGAPLKVTLDVVDAPADSASRGTPTESAPGAP